MISKSLYGFRVRLCLTQSFRCELEQQWASVVLLIVREISFIWKSMFGRMYWRLQQAKRVIFRDANLNESDYGCGNISVILVGDFG